MRTLGIMFLVSVLGCGASNQRESDAGAGGGGGSDDAGSDTGSGGTSGWYKSGTRIKMRVLNTPDGAKQFSGWHDTARGHDCTFILTADGATRCVPFYPDIAHLAGSYYADSSCTVPVIRHAACAAPPKFIFRITTVGTSCATSAYGPFYPRGQMYTTAYEKNPTTSACTAVPSDAQYVYFGLGAEIPLTEFQAGTTAIE